MLRRTPASTCSVYLDRFVGNTSNLTALGIVWLAVTALMLLSTIEGAFNAIWRVEAPRPFMMRLVAYWTTLTLGPLLIGTGLSLSTVIVRGREYGAARHRFRRRCQRPGIVLAVRASPRWA